MQSNQMAPNAIEENTFVYLQRLWKTHWLTDYALDIFVNMKEAEMRRRPKMFSSSQVDEQRRSQLELCQLAARTYKLNRATVHLGVYYMDCLTDHFKIRKDKLPLLALTCLHIAAQIENTDASVPRYTELNSLVRGGYTLFEYKVVERKVLSHLNFELIRPTTASFVEFFACSFLTRTDYADYTAMLANPDAVKDLDYVQYESYEAMLSTLSQLLMLLADCTLSINSFANTRPSLLAAVCIAGVRLLNGLKCWSEYLTKLTSYPEYVVEALVGQIIQYYRHVHQECYAEPYGVSTFVDMGPSSADSINPNWSTPDSGIGGESVIIVEEVVTVKYDIITVQLQQPVAASQLAVVAQEVPILNQRELQEQAPLLANDKLQEQAPLLAHDELQEQAPPLACDKLQEQALPLAHEELQEQAPPLAHDELQEQAPAFAHDELQKQAPPLAHDELQEQVPPLAHDKLQEQAAPSAHDKLQESSLVAMKTPQESIAVAMDELQRSFKRKRIEDDGQEEPQAKRLH